MHFSFAPIIAFGLLLMSLMVDSTGDLVMIRSPQRTNNGSIKLKLTCMTDDNDGALFWMGNQSNIHSLDVCELTSELVDLEKCHYNYSMSSTVKSIAWLTREINFFYWKVQRTSTFPSEPGLRSRLPGKGYCQLYGSLEDQRNSGSLIFFHQEWLRRNSTVRECPQEKNDQSKLRNCSVTHLELKLYPESGHQYKWHLYGFTWNKSHGVLAGFESLNRTVEKYPSDSTQVAINFHDKTPTVFYGYRYLRTTLENSSLKFVVSSFSNHICLSLIVSLCRECQFKISIGSSASTDVYSIKTIVSKSEYKNDGEPNWQLTEIEETLESYDSEYIIINVTTTKNETCSGCYWSFYSLRTCTPRTPSLKNFRTISAMTDRHSNLPCQKISVHENIVIDSNASITNVPSKTLKNRLRMNRPFCDSECGTSCNGTSICYSTAGSTNCTCAPGFHGENCDQECPYGNFGYNCVETCRSCKERNCKKTSGSCILGCAAEDDLLPYCERKLSKPHITYSVPVKTPYQKTLSADEKKYIRYEIQEEEASGQWISITGDDQELSTDTFVWSEEMMQSLNPYRKYNIRAVLNGTKSLPISLDVSQLLPGTVKNFGATNSEASIAELEWHSQIRWQNMKWFCLKIESLASKQRNSLSRQTQFWKLYPIKKNQTKYSGTVLLEAAQDYNITLLVSPNDIEKGLILKSLGNYRLKKTIHLAKGNDLRVNRGANSIDLYRPSIVNKIDTVIVRVLVYGLLDCQKVSLPNISREWETETYKGKRTMPEILTISNISGCELLPNASYIVKVLVSDPVNKNSILFVIDIEAFSPCHWIWITVSLVSISCILGVAYMLYRNPNQESHAQIYDLNTLLNNSDAHLEKLVTFENSVRKEAENGLLEQQFTLLPKGLVRPCEYGRLPENKYKNRYGNLIAYDDTRVMLVKNPGEPYSDYINANYVQGYSKKNAYIATQGPLPETVKDFWRMVWQEEVRVICMLVDLVEGPKVMCEVYWPEVGRRVEYGNFVISNVAEHKFADYTCRTFVVSTRSGTEQRQVEHLQYRCWTDQEIPTYSHSLLEYLNKLRAIPTGPGPVVVHCSAGVGRTGCFILCDICLHYMIAEGTVNVRAEAESIYNARANMLRNYLQYTLAHLVPIQFRCTLATNVPCRDLSWEKIQELKNDLPLHVNWLTSSTWMHEALRPFEPLRPTHPENVLKNRFQKFMPAGPHLVKLPRYPEYDTTSDYISAVSVDGLKMKKQYLASQLPMPSTLTDFWRLIVKENVDVIVILHKPDPEDDTCCAVIPREKTLIPYPYVKVETKETLESNEYFTTSMLLVTNSTQVQKTTRNITVITCNDWRYDLVTKPPPPEALIKLWSASEEMRCNSAPTLVLCYDGFTACGLYIAMSYVLQKISLDQECDVIAAVQAVRRSRSEFVQFQWEFEYLYDAVMNYMDIQ